MKIKYLTLGILLMLINSLNATDCLRKLSDETEASLEEYEEDLERCDNMTYANVKCRKEASSSLEKNLDRAMVAFDNCAT